MCLQLELIRASQFWLHVRCYGFYLIFEPLIVWLDNQQVLKALLAFLLLCIIIVFEGPTSFDKIMHS